MSASDFAALLVPAFEAQATAMASGDQLALEIANQKIADLLRQLQSASGVRSEKAGLNPDLAGLVSLKNTLVGNSKIVSRKRTSTRQALEALGLQAPTYAEGSEPSLETSRQKRSFIA